MSRLSSILLVMVILFAQAALLEHEYDFAAHKSGETCVICLHATPLSHGMVGALFMAFPLPIHRTEFHPLDLQIVAVAVRAYRARAPPFVPSV
jgi:hypothetical protein